MKRVILALAILLLPVVAGAGCGELSVDLINQDPYPAIPGDYVKVVFQLDGVGDADCGIVTFRVLEEFPFSLKEETSSTTTLNSGVYVRNYESFAILPYTLKVDTNALDGPTPIEVSYFDSETKSIQIKDFNIEIEDVRTDFEISVKDYNPQTRILTFEILNVGKTDAEALTVEIPKQDSIIIKGPNRNIIGSLDSNEDSSFTFEAIPTDGEIKINVYYNDEINTRRTLEKSTNYDSSYFTDRVRDAPTTSKWYYVLLLIIIVVVLLWLRKKFRKKRKP